MKYVDFKREIENGDCRSAYLFTGEESYFADQGYALLKNKYLSEPSLNLVTFDGASLEISELISSFYAFPFLSEKRITFVKEFYPNIDAISKLKEALNSSVSDGILIISNTKECKELEKLNTIAVVECKKAEPSEIARIIKAYCSERNVAIDMQTATSLAEYCLCDMVRVQLEMQKLCDYACESGKITEEILDQLVNRDSDYKIYNMTEYIARKQFDLALTVVKEMIESGSAPMLITASIYKHFRELLHVAISGKSDAELMESLGKRDFQIRKLRSQASMFKVRALKSAVDYLVDADVRIKTGQTLESEQLWLSLFTIMIN